MNLRSPGVYDVLGNRIAKTFTPVPGGPVFKNEYYVPESGRTALQFEDAPGTPNPVRLKARNLYAAAVDQVLASEELSYNNTGAATVNKVAWSLPDQKGSVRDIVFASLTGGAAGSIHFKYDKFGFCENVAEETLIKTRYAGQEYDPETGLCYKNGQTYDARSARNLSAPPAGRDAGTTNFYHARFNTANSVAGDGPDPDLVQRAQYMNQWTNIVAAASVAPLLAMTGGGATVGLMAGGAAAGAINGALQTWAANPNADVSEYATSMLLGAGYGVACPGVAIGGLFGTAIAGTGAAALGGDVGYWMQVGNLVGGFYGGVGMAFAHGGAPAAVANMAFLGIPTAVGAGIDRANGGNGLQGANLGMMAGGIAYAGAGVAYAGYRAYNASRLAPGVLRSAATVEVASGQLEGPYALVNGQRVAPTGYGRVYHALSSSEIPDPMSVVTEGLPSRGSNLDLLNHVESGGDSAFRGATRIQSDPIRGQGAAYWAGEGGWVVEVEGAPWWDVNALLEGRVSTPGGFRGNLMYGENELPLLAKISPENISRLGQVKENAAGQLYIQWMPR